MQLKFSKAIYVGDTVTAQVQVAKVRPDKPICQLVVEVKNQNGEICLSGDAATYTVALKNNP